MTTPRTMTIKMTMPMPASPMSKTSPPRAGVHVVKYSLLSAGRKASRPGVAPVPGSGHSYAHAQRPPPSKGPDRTVIGPGGRHPPLRVRLHGGPPAGAPSRPEGGGDPQDGRPTGGARQEHQPGGRLLVQQGAGRLAARGPGEVGRPPRVLRPAAGLRRRAPEIGTDGGGDQGHSRSAEGRGLRFRAAVPPQPAVHAAPDGDRLPEAGGAAELPDAPHHRIVHPADQGGR